VRFIGGELGYQILKWICPRGESGYNDGSSYIGKSKLEVLLGQSLWSEIEGRSVIDLGCGEGAEAVELAERGAARVLGVDIDLPALERARARAARAGVSDRCSFADSTSEQADVIVALDSFEHFLDLPGMLVRMHSMLRPGGFILSSFGPTWYHPLGGHLFSVFPWAHFVFTEKACIRWRADFRDDGHSSFEEVGLSRLSIGHFERVVARSPLQLERFETVPIRRLRPVHTRVTREFTTSVVRCKLTPRRRPDA
jgi:SAM-dependent methyltransferase